MVDGGVRISPYPLSDNEVALIMELKMRTLIKAVSRIVTAQAGSCCRCRFPLEDEYGKYEGYESHDNWELWHQDHDNINFEYFLKCTGCGYELAKQYWKDSDGTFVDYTDGIAEDCHESKIEHCNDCKQVSVFRINEYQDPFYVDGVRLRECIQCGRYETPQKSVLPYEAGDRIYIWVNQGERGAWVLGTLEDQIIVEYEMPSGTTALRILQNADYVNEHKFGKGVGYKSCPKKWIQAIRDGVGGWEGVSQGKSGYNHNPESRSYGEKLQEIIPFPDESV